MVRTNVSENEDTTVDSRWPVDEKLVEVPIVCLQNKDEDINSNN